MSGVRKHVSVDFSGDVGSDRIEFAVSPIGSELVVSANGILIRVHSAGLGAFVEFFEAAIALIRDAKREQAK